MIVEPIIEYKHVGEPDELWTEWELAYDRHLDALRAAMLTLLVEPDIPPSSIVVNWARYTRSREFRLRPTT